MSAANARCPSMFGSGNGSIWKYGENVSWPKSRSSSMRALFRWQGPSSVGKQGITNMGHNRMPTKAQNSQGSHRSDRARRLMNEKARHDRASWDVLDSNQ